MTDVEDTPTGGLLLTGKTYDRVKQIVQLWLPAISTLYFTLANVWDLPGAEKVVGSIAAVTTFLGVILKISTNNYEARGIGVDGSMVVTDVEGHPTFSLILDATPEDLAGKDSITLKVGKPPVENTDLL